MVCKIAGTKINEKTKVIKLGFMVCKSVAQRRRRTRLTSFSSSNSSAWAREIMPKNEMKTDKQSQNTLDLA